MEIISEEIVQKAWEDLGSSTPEEISIKGNDFCSKQPLLLGFVMANCKDLSQDAIGVVVYLAQAIYIMYELAYGNIPQVKEQLVDEIDAKNSKQMERLADDQHFFGEIAGLENQFKQKNVFIYLMEVLIEENDSDAHLTENEKGILFIVLKSVIESLDEVVGNMKNIPDIGRNDPCYCGSGKKYKKCCLKKDEMKERYGLPEEFKTGTAYDDYMELYRGVALFANSLRFTEYKTAMETAENDFQRRFRPGEPGGVTDSMFMTWLFLDYRFGSTQQTVCERFMDSEFGRGLLEPAPTFLPRLANSYFAFYEVKNITDLFIVFEEIGTSTVWRYRKSGQEFEEQGMVGNIWYVRFVGTTQESYAFCTPYIYPPNANKYIVEIMDSLKKEFVNANKGRIPPDQMFRELCKENVYLWADYIANGPSHEVELEELSNMVNTDGEPMSFTNIYFKIRHPADLQKKLNKIKDFTFDPDAKTWQWLGRGRGKNKGRVFKGGVTIEGDHLIGETNSLERALELKYLIINKLNDSVTYHELESSAVPKVSLDELKRFEEEQRKINSTPEAQEMIKQQMDEYYLNEWISAKIPALNNKTPRQMIKTAEGCAKVEELLQYMEKRNNTLPDHMYRFDFNRLRRKLGLPVK